MAPSLPILLRMTKSFYHPGKIDTAKYLASIIKHPSAPQSGE
jgi:hypothetical protein